MSKKINRDLLQRAVSLLQARKVRHPGGSIESYKIHYTQIILEKMFQSDDCWLSICPFNYHNGNSNLFEEKLISLQHWNLEILDATFLIAIKFLQEAELTTRRQSRNSIFDDNTYETIWDWFRSLKNDDISPDEISQLNYIQSDY